MLAECTHARGMQSTMSVHDLERASLYTATSASLTTCTQPQGRFPAEHRHKGHAKTTHQPARSSSFQRTIRACKQASKQGRRLVLGSSGVSHLLPYVVALKGKGGQHVILLQPGCHCLHRSIVHEAPAHVQHD